MDPPRDEMLLKAARNGDWAEMSRLRDEGTDIDKVMGFEFVVDGSITALSTASEHGHLECVQKLVEMGAGGNDYDQHMVKYKFAMKMAAVKGHLECFRFLVENRLFKAVDDIQKYHVFIGASRNRDFDQIQKLLVGNVDKDILNGWKGNNLMSLFVVYGCPPSCLQVLIDQGVDVNGVDYNGFTPLMCAVLTENMNCVRFLLGLEVAINQGTVNDTTLFLENGTTRPRDDEMYDDGPTALMYASCFRNNESLRQMLQVVTDIDYNFNFRRWSALNFAAHFGQQESVALLIKFGASVDAQDVNNHCSPLHAMSKKQADCLEVIMKVFPEDQVQDLIENAALCVSDVHCLRILLNYLGDLDSPEVSQAFLLIGAAEHGQFDSVRLLLDHGVGINVRNFSGATALMMSCDDRHQDILDLLIKGGADIHIKDEEGDTAIMYAAKHNAVKCLEKLMSHGASIHARNEKGETALMITCEHGHDQVVDLLIKSGADVNGQNDDHCPAVCYATTVKCLQQLIEHGADIYVKDGNKKNILMFACEKGHGVVVEFLISQGWDINAQDGAGKTAIMYAADQNHDKCVKLLLDEGSNLDLTDKEGGTVFSIAMCGNGSCVDVLLHSGKLLCDGVLKSEHKQAMCVMNKIEMFNIRCVLSTMDFGIFEWDWCCLADSLESIAFAIGLRGIRPGKLEFRDNEMSLLLLAFIKEDINSIGYLLAHRYLFPEDYKILTTDNAFMDDLKENISEETSSILKKINAEPQSLQTLSFFAMSNTVSLSGCPTGWSSLMESVPLSERTKQVLRCKIDMSKLCTFLWFEIEIPEPFLLFMDETMFEGYERCQESCDNCCGLGLCAKFLV